MISRQKLVTEKYWASAVKEQTRYQKRYRNREAIRNLITFLFGLAAIFLGIYVVEATQVSWPDVSEFISDFPDHAAKTLLKFERWMRT